MRSTTLYDACDVPESGRTDILTVCPNTASCNRFLTMSLILMPNKVGDKMFPCGTLCSCSNMSDNVLPIRTLNDRFDKKF